MEKGEATYTLDELDHAIFAISPYLQYTFNQTGRVQCAKFAAVDAFVHPENHLSDDMDLLREALKDLNSYGMFNFLDSE